MTYLLPIVFALTGGSALMFESFIVSRSIQTTEI